MNLVYELTYILWPRCRNGPTQGRLCLKIQTAANLGLLYEMEVLNNVVTGFIGLGTYYP